ncbi:MAG: hypothetical protein ABEH66_05575 [Halobacteriales archaeon]
MTELEVFGTDGARLYPEGDGTEDGKYREWDDSVYVDVAVVDDDRVALTMYARFRIDGEVRPTFVRYVTEADADLRDGLREVVERTLVGDAGWEVVDSEGVGDPGFLFPNLVWREDPRHPHPSTGTTGTGLPEPTNPALATILDEPGKRFAVRTRDFRFAATLVDRYWTDIDRLRVTDDPDMTPEDKLVVYRDGDMDPSIDLPSEIRTLVEETERRLAEEGRSESYDQLDDALARLADLDTPPQDVADELAAAAGRNFDEVRVAGPEDPDYEARYREARQRVGELEARTEELEESLREAEADPDSVLGRLLGS